MKGLHPRCAALAAFAFAAVMAYQLLVVYAGHGGNWTGLYWFGSAFPPPQQLSGMDVVVHDNTAGYDGQFYYYVAIDPFFTQGYAAAIDLPRFRYRRILVPLLAHVLGAGQAEAILVTYALVSLLAVPLGVYWLARLAERMWRAPAWGLAFLAVPAVLVSLDRQTVDGMLAAFCVGFTLYAAERRTGPLLAVLALAMLTRETGLLLIAAASGTAFLQRRFGTSVLLACAVAPALLWYAFVHAHPSAYEANLFDPVPLRHWFMAFAAPPAYADFGAMAWLPRSLDRLGLLGALVAMGAALRQGRRAFSEALPCAALLFALLAAWHSAPGGWSDSYGYARTFTPLLLLVALDGFARGSPLSFVPPALPVPRILMQLAAQAVTLFRS
jgi:hypothetical protein